MKQNKRKAFTLTELLVVVIVLAVLAAVAMPKFRRTLETRRTTEAENMLSAIRTEQEKRCIMGYDYQTDATKLGVLAKAGSSKHYDYSLQSTGATAATQGYELQIPSYKDGRICCSGEGCEALNKNYPSCESITVAEDECAASVPAEPEPEEPDDPGDPDDPYTYTITDENGCVDTYSYEGEECYTYEWEGEVREWCSKKNLQKIDTTCECKETEYSYTFSTGSTYNPGSCTRNYVSKKCVKRDEQGNFVMGSPDGILYDDLSYEKSRECSCEYGNQVYSEEQGTCVCRAALEPIEPGTACCVTRKYGDITKATGKLVGWFTDNLIGCEVLPKCETYVWHKLEEVDLSECPEGTKQSFHSGLCDPATLSEWHYFNYPDKCYKQICALGTTSDNTTVGACSETP